MVFYAGNVNIKSRWGVRAAYILINRSGGDSCPVKVCCEKKEKEHCGQCGDFPCDLLKQFAYDEQQGDDGKRIEQCRCWAGSGQ